MALTKSDTLNYLGALYQIGGQSHTTAFLNVLGGMAGGGAKTYNSLVFPLNVQYTPASGSQPAIAEDDSCGTLTPNTTTRSQEYNTAQIFQRAYGVSYVKQAQFGAMSGINIQGATNSIVDEFGFQRAVELKNMAIQMDYTFLNGAYQLAANTATAAKTRGLITAITTNVVAAGGAALSKSLIDSVLLAMVAGGAAMENLVIIVGAYQKVQISNVYGYQPESYTMGGVAIDSILTDFGRVGIIFDTHVAADTLVIANMALLNPVYVPIDGQIFIDEEFARTTASKTGQLMTIAGIDYAYEEAHGKITGLKSS